MCIRDSILNGDTDRGRFAIYGAYVNKQRMVTMGGHKMIVYPAIDKTLLFNLRNDALEVHNLADDPSQKWRLEEMKRALKSLQKETGDSLDLDKKSS